jgi:ADP-dependent NAD(P)H-hydrate dehydratase
MNKPIRPVSLQPAAAANAPIAVNDFLLSSWPLPTPPAEGDKEMKGRILLVGGSPEMPGAILLAATAALHAGAGKLTVATAASVAPLVAARMPEARVIALAEDADKCLQAGALQAGLADQASRFDAVVIGPGMLARQSLLEDIAALLPAFTDAAVLLDACAMDVVRLPAWRERAADAKPPVLLTPHAGEMAHLTDGDKEAIQAEPQAVLQQYSRD